MTGPGLHPALRTRLLGLFGCEVPIVQTGMGWVATPELVAAACEAGAFGFLAAATIPPPEVEAAIEQVKSLTERPDRKAMLTLGAPWRPFRSAAARFLWHLYRHPGVALGRGVKRSA